MEVTLAIHRKQNNNKIKHIFHFFLSFFFPAPIQTPINVPRMVNSTQIRASSGAAIIQQHPANVQIQSHPPALHPVSQNTFAPGGAQVSAMAGGRISVISKCLIIIVCIVDSCGACTCCAFSSSNCSNSTNGHGKWGAHHST